MMLYYLYRLDTNFRDGISLSSSFEIFESSYLSNKLSEDGNNRIDGLSVVTVNKVNFTVKALCLVFRKFKKKNLTFLFLRTGQILHKNDAAFLKDLF